MINSDQLRFFHQTGVVRGASVLDDHGSSLAKYTYPQEGRSRHPGACAQAHLVLLTGPEEATTGWVAFMG